MTWPGFKLTCLSLYYTLGMFVIIQPWVNLFDSLKVHLASCLAPRNHCEGKCENFITRRINNKSPSDFSFDTCRHSSNFEKPASIFFHLGEWKIVSVEGKRSSFERSTILSNLPGNLKVFWWLTYFNNTTLFILRGGSQLACFAENL